jgi:hypothetical protein
MVGRVPEMAVIKLLLCQSLPVPCNLQRHPICCPRKAVGRGGPVTHYPFWPGEDMKDTLIAAKSDIYLAKYRNTTTTERTTVARDLQIRNCEPFCAINCYFRSQDYTCFILGR